MLEELVKCGSCNAWEGRLLAKMSTPCLQFIVLPCDTLDISDGGDGGTGQLQDEVELVADLGAVLCLGAD